MADSRDNVEPVNPWWGRGPLGDWGKTLAGMGVVAFACWLVMTEQHALREEMREARRMNLDALKESRQEYRADLTEMRNRYQKVSTDSAKVLTLVEAIHVKVVTAPATPPVGGK